MFEKLVGVSVTISNRRTQSVSFQGSDFIASQLVRAEQTSRYPDQAKISVAYMAYLTIYTRKLGVYSLVADKIKTSLNTIAIRSRIPVTQLEQRIKVEIRLQATAVQAVSKVYYKYTHNGNTAEVFHWAAIILALRAFHKNDIGLTPSQIKTVKDIHDADAKR